MNLVTRGFICKRLKISRRTCFNLIQSVNGNVTEQQVLKILNDSASNCRPFTMIPDGLMTVREAADTIKVNGVPITTERLLSWVNDPSLRVPHLRITSKSIRIPAASFEVWASNRFDGNGRKRGAK
jgi:hypothetical protein